MDSTKITEIIIALLGGGALGALMNYRLGNRKQQLPEFDAIVREYKSLYEQLEDRVKQLERYIETLESENDRLKEYKKIYKQLDERVKELQGHTKKLEDENNRLLRLLEKYEQGKK